MWSTYNLVSIYIIHILTNFRLYFRASVFISISLWIPALQPCSGFEILCLHILMDLGAIMDKQVKTVDRWLIERQNDVVA